MNRAHIRVRARSAAWFGARAVKGRPSAAGGGNTLVFTTSNQMKSSGRSQKKTSQGIENVRIRMEHAYGADFKFVTACQGEHFETFLSFPG